MPIDADSSLSVLQNVEKEMNIFSTKADDNM